ncbi:MAG: DNA methyltransferase [Gemmatimonadales bacterium]
MAELLIDLASIPLDTATVPQDTLDILTKTRSNPLPWKGQFSPQLVHALLEAYRTESDQTILDPFAGSGTVLVEAARLGLGAIAAEVNPAPHLLSRIYQYCTASDLDRATLLADVEAAIGFALELKVGLFGGAGRDEDELVEPVLGTRRRVTSRVLDLVDATLVLSGMGSPGFSRERLFSAWTQVKALVRNLPSTRAPICAVMADARSLPVKDGTADLVLTSPPYINVFNYHQQYRQTVELLGWDVLAAAQSEIGSNRKHRANRFLTVVQYALDMADVLGELCRAAKPDARMIVVIGRESSVRGAPVPNGELLLNLATAANGLDLLARQERKFLNRFGQVIFEDLLHFRATPHVPNRERAVDVAVAALRRLRGPSLSSEVGDAIDQAIDQSSTVLPSPLLVPPNVHHLRASVAK